MTFAMGLSSVQWHDVGVTVLPLLKPSAESVQRQLRRSLTASSLWIVFLSSGRIFREWLIIMMPLFTGAEAKFHGLGKCLDQGKFNLNLL